MTEPHHSASRPGGAPVAEAVLYCDGASRGNPGAASIGFVLVDSSGNELVAHGETIGRQTNNVAEYTALRHGLEAALARGIHRLQVRMDSELVVRQMLGIYRVKNPHLAPLFATVRALASRFATFRIEHVPRRDNARADGLANAALDAVPSGEE